MRGCCSLASARASILIVGVLLVPGVASAAKLPLPSSKRPFAYDTSGVVGIGAAPASVNGPAVLQFQGVTNDIFHPKSGQTIALGQFVVTPTTSSTGQTTTYTDTPFQIQVRTPEFDKTNSVPVLSSIFPKLGKDLKLKTLVENSLLLKGHLDGTVGPNGQVNVLATVDSIKLGGLDAKTSDHSTRYTFPIRFSQFKLPPGWMMGTSNLTTTLPTAAAPMIPAGTATAQPVTAAQILLPDTATVLPAPAAEMLTATPTTATTPAPSMTPTPTPEPSTIVFFAIALGGLVLGRRHLAAG